MNDFNFFDSKKKLKKLWLLEKLYQEPQLTQYDLADEVGITKGMVSRYIKEFKKEGLLANEGKYKLTKPGISLLFELRKKYKNELAEMHKFINQERQKYQELNISQIKIAAIKSLGAMIPFLARKLEVMSDYPVEFEVDYYQSGQHLMENFTSQNYDFGILGIVPAFLWQASGTTINIEAKVNDGGHAIIGRDWIHSLADLEGETVLVPEINDSVSDNLLKKVSNQKDIHLKRVDFSDLGVNWKQLLTDKNSFSQVDAVLLWEPYISYILHTVDNFHLIYDFQNYHQDYSANVLISNSKQIEVNIQEIIFELFRETIDKIKKNKKEVINHLSEFFQMENSVINSALKRVEFKYSKKWEEK